MVRFALLSQRFTSMTVLQRPERIDVSSTDGPVRKLDLTWLFEALPDDGCQVSLSVELQLRSLVLQSAFSQAMFGAVEHIMSAFEDRARSLYGIDPD